MDQHQTDDDKIIQEIINLDQTGMRGLSPQKSAELLNSVVNGHDQSSSTMQTDVEVGVPVCNQVTQQMSPSDASSPKYESNPSQFMNINSSQTSQENQMASPTLSNQNFAKGVNRLSDSLQTFRDFISNTNGIFVNQSQSGPGVGAQSPLKGLSVVTNSDMTGIEDSLQIQTPEITTTARTLPNFESLSSSQQPSPEIQNSDKSSSMLEKLLTRNQAGLTDFNISNNLSPSSTSISSPDNQVESPPPISSSSSPFMDANTQSSLIAKSEQLHLDSDSITNDDELQLLSWTSPQRDWDEEDEDRRSAFEKNPKAQKISEDSDAPSSVLDAQLESVFDVGEAVSTGPFTFSKFGKGVEGVFTFSGSAVSTSTTSTTTRIVSSTVEDGQFKTPQTPALTPAQSTTRTKHTHQTRYHNQRKSKEPTLNQQFPAKQNGIELKILSQPEEQHRARYLTEGSRGAVKNRNQQGSPIVKLVGFTEPATLQVFIGNDSGRVKPHGFYQACKVSGKNSTQCSEKDIDGTTVIEIELKPATEMTAAIDCVGILKLRNADVENRIGIAKAKKKSTKARMIFRVSFQNQDGYNQTLQVPSCPILCTQPIGQPEICKMSLSKSPASGGQELFIIGKNFLRGTQVFFQELSSDGTVLWEREAEIDKDYFQSTHLICSVPEYNKPMMSGPSSSVSVQIVVHTGGKQSEAQLFQYTAVDLPIKQEVPMETEEQTSKNPLSFVAPEAIQLNEQIQQSQQGSSTFQLPPGMIPGVGKDDASVTPMDQNPVLIKDNVTSPLMQSESSLSSSQFHFTESPLTDHTPQNSPLLSDLNHAASLMSSKSEMFDFSQASAVETPSTGFQVGALSIPKTVLQIASQEIQMSSQDVFGRDQGHYIMSVPSHATSAMETQCQQGVSMATQVQQTAAVPSEPQQQLTLTSPSFSQVAMSTEQQLPSVPTQQLGQQTYVHDSLRYSCSSQNSFSQGQLLNQPAFLKDQQSTGQVAGFNTSSSGTDTNLQNVISNQSSRQPFSLDSVPFPGLQFDGVLSSATASLFAQDQAMDSLPKIASTQSLVDSVKDPKMVSSIQSSNASQGSMPSADVLDSLRNILVNSSNQMHREPVSPQISQAPQPMTATPAVLQQQQPQQQQQAAIQTVQSSVPMPGAQVPSQSAVTSSGGPALQNNAPQIIICNNPGQQGLLNNINPQYAAPSIVIVPGGGANNSNSQVENILRSILGSLTQPPPVQQQLPQS